MSSRVPPGPPAQNAAQTLAAQREMQSEAAAQALTKGKVEEFERWENHYKKALGLPPNELVAQGKRAWMDVQGWREGAMAAIPKELREQIACPGVVSGQPLLSSARSWDCTKEVEYGTTTARSGEAWCSEMGMGASPAICKPLSIGGPRERCRRETFAKAMAKQMGLGRATPFAQSYFACMTALYARRKAALGPDGKPLRGVNHGPALDLAACKAARSSLRLCRGCKSIAGLIRKYVHKQFTLAHFYDGYCERARQALGVGAGPRFSRIMGECMSCGPGRRAALRGASKSCSKLRDGQYSCGALPVGTGRTGVLPLPTSEWRPCPGMWGKKTQVTPVAKEYDKRGRVGVCGLTSARNPNCKSRYTRPWDKWGSYLQGIQDNLDCRLSERLVFGEPLGGLNEVYREIKSANAPRAVSRREAEMLEQKCEESNREWLNMLAGMQTQAPGGRKLTGPQVPRCTGTLGRRGRGGARSRRAKRRRRHKRTTRVRRARRSRRVRRARRSRPTRRRR